jgi:hypothetical protein
MIRQDMADEENFLRRWSRRKLERVREEARPAPAAAEKPAPSAAAPAAPVAAVPRAEPELPSIDSLKGLASDYKEFLDPAVGEDLRRSALKKLFHDPHFNVMDGLDVYIDDYSKPDPIPESMLKDLLARHFSAPDAEEQPAKAEAEPRLAEAPAPDPASAPPETAPPESAPAADAAPAPAEESKR